MAECQPSSSKSRSISDKAKRFVNSGLQMDSILDITIDSSLNDDEQNVAHYLESGFPSNEVKREAQSAHGPKLLEELRFSKFSDFRFPWQTGMEPSQPNGRLNGAEDSTCSICYEQISINGFVDSRLSDACDHELATCLKCLERYLEAQIELAPNQIPCPNCTAILRIEIIETYAPEASLARFHRRMIADALQNDSSFRRCLRTACQFAQIHVGGDSAPIITCGECGYKMCFTHRSHWHEGQTCLEYDRFLEEQLGNDQATQQLLTETYKSCRGCGQHWDLYDGCDHITCPNCKHEWCWPCRADYKTILANDKSYHALDCRYRSARLPRHAILNPRASFPNG